MSGEDPSLGTLKLVVSGGSIVRKDRSRGSRNIRINEMKSTSEEKAIKEGKSVGVARDGVELPKSLKSYVYTFSNTQVFDRLSIVVHIRERSWLVRHRILTEDGKPWTNEDAEPKHAESQSVGEESGEIIDLT